MKIKRSPMGPTIQQIALAMCALIFAGCSKSVPVNEELARNLDARPMAKDAAQTAVTNKMWVAEAVDTWTDAVPVQVIPLHKRQQAFLNLYNLEVNRERRVTWTLFDGNGVGIYTNSWVFTPTGPGWTVWEFFQPDRKLHKPGDWRWTVQVAGIGTLEAKLNVRAPTSQENDELTRYDDIREHAFRAFSHYWFGQDGYFFTQPWRGGQTLQVSHLYYSFQESNPSLADSFNGVTYIGTATFGFKVYRIAAQGDTWEDWKDNNERVPDEVRDSVAASFSIGERDKNWFVESVQVKKGGDTWFGGAPTYDKTGDVFVNDVLVSTNWSSRPVQPSPEYVRELMKQPLSRSRKDALAIAAKAKAQEAELPQPTKATMTQLRGRPR